MDTWLRTLQAVVRVFFSSGLYKTAAIDDTVSAVELCRMIARKVRIERRVEVGPDNCTLFECRDTTPAPWSGSPFGTAYRVIPMDERPFAILRGWVAEDLVAQSRFVIVVLEQNPAVMRASARAAGNPLWRPSCHLEAPLAADKQRASCSVVDGDGDGSENEDESDGDDDDDGIPAAPVGAPPRPDGLVVVPQSTTGATTNSATTATATTTPAASETEAVAARRTRRRAAGRSVVGASLHRAGARSSLCAGPAAECAPATAAPVLAFVNARLAGRGLHAATLEDLRSGVLVAALLETLTGRAVVPADVSVEAAAADGAAPDKRACLATWAAVLRVLQEHGCGLEHDIPEDCYYGPQTALVALVALVAERFAGSSGAAATAVAQEVVRLLEDLQQQHAAVRALAAQLQERETRVFQKEIELERREAAVAARERHLAAAASAASPAPPTPPPPAPMPNVRKKRAPLS